MVQAGEARRLSGVERRLRIDHPDPEAARAAVAMIETERLILRGWREADVEPFIRHTNTPAVMRWLGGVRDEAQVREMLVGKFNQWLEERGFTFWAVERREDGELLGFCGLKIADDPGTGIQGLTEVGWRLREDVWGQGYAKEAAVASLDFAFDRAGPRRWWR
jgi:RimJ/RimL family protein N-acetyltransferase